MNPPETAVRRDILDILAPGRKRNLRQITATLAQLEPQDRIVATMRSDVYGPYVIRGRVVVSSATGSLLTGGQPLDTATATRKPVPELLDLVLDDTTPAPRADPCDECRGSLDASVSDLGHGDVIEADFVQAPYGLFTISGFVVHVLGHGVLVAGGWFLTVPGRRDAATRLRSVRVVADADNHGLHPPARITDWSSPDM
jgi:hypothetical protein